MDEARVTPESSGDPRPTPDFAVGAAAIREALKTIPGSPGVYRMVDQAGEVLYVGKARDLKRRVASYTQPTRLDAAKMRMVGLTRGVIVVTTRTEAEALLLEANLIKRYRTRFNVLLRDDKSFPYIHLRLEHDWPQIAKHRGARKGEGRFYGPFASAGAVNGTLNTLQRVFLLRSCSDTVFEGRSRPCLLYQIKRCAAPCVDRIDKPAYDQLVADARDFLEGRSKDIQRKLAADMQAASDALEFERAAALRDRLRALAQIQARQDINLASLGDADIIAVAQQGGASCVQLFFIRNGLNWGSWASFPRHDKDAGEAAVLAAFISQFYDNKPPPKRLLLSHRLDEPALLAEALSLKAGNKVTIETPRRGDKRRLVALAERNALAALERRLAESSSQARLLSGVAALFDLDAPPSRIEVYDNSHIAGTNALGAMIVAGPEGFEKNAYRKFNIKSADLSPGDDYAMMREVLERRFAKLAKADTDDTGAAGPWPDLVLIDGGAGQLSAACQVLDDLGLAQRINLVAISKGPDRNAGREQFHRPGHAPFSLPPTDPVLYFLQRLRDEAHRFAISSHRARRAKASLRSSLDSVPGIGAKRKKALLHHFGSARAVAQAGVAELTAVDGISRQMAEAIYGHFHNL
ncbi:MAG: excinuclease ABC subunit UvrC [Sphingomonadales bacterium]